MICFNQALDVNWITLRAGNDRTMTDSNQNSLAQPLTGWRLRLDTIIFRANTRAGRWIRIANAT